MLMCTRCHKRPAVVFVSNSLNGQDTHGLCLVCAKELGIKPVNDIIDKMGISDEELLEASDQMSQMLDSDDEDMFSPGGAATMLPTNMMLGGAPGANGGESRTAAREKKENFHKKKRKHIQNFCTDLTG